MAGRRTSVYLSEELDAAVKAAGVPMAELLQRGLAATDVTVGRTAVYEAGRRQGRHESDLDHGDFDTDDRESGIPDGYVAPAGLAFLRPENCPHRSLRPGAWCKTCQSVVPERGKR